MATTMYNHGCLPLQAFYSCFLIVLMLLDPAAAATSQVNREEIDSRSVFVGNVRVFSLFTLSLGACVLCECWDLILSGQLTCCP